jgi:hypothetical protein
VFEVAGLRLHAGAGHNLKHRYSCAQYRKVNVAVFRRIQYVIKYQVITDKYKVNVAVFRKDDASLTPYK